MGRKGTDACLAKVSDDEPIFVLRAQDLLAPGLVRLWASQLAGLRGPAHPKVMEALNLALEMEAWSTRKVPD